VPHATIPDGIEIEPYHSPLAGAPLAEGESRSDYHGYGQQLRDANANVYTPFQSKLDWDIARWMKLRGPSSSSLQELLEIDGV
jgi:hypothetical protein